VTASQVLKADKGCHEALVGKAMTTDAVIRMMTLASVEGISGSIGDVVL
jgi:hypothetical protein